MVTRCSAQASISRATNSSCFGADFLRGPAFTWITSGSCFRNARTFGDRPFSIFLVIAASPGSNGVPVNDTSSARLR